MKFYQPRLQFLRQEGRGTRIGHDRTPRRRPPPARSRSFLRRRTHNQSGRNTQRQHSSQNLKTQPLSRSSRRAVVYSPLRSRALPRVFPRSSALDRSWRLRSATSTIPPPARSRTPFHRRLHSQMSFATAAVAIITSQQRRFRGRSASRSLLPGPPHKNLLVRRLFCAGVLMLLHVLLHPLLVPCQHIVELGFLVGRQHLVSFRLQFGMLHFQLLMCLG